MKMRLIIISLMAIALIGGCRKAVNASYGFSGENKDNLYNQEVSTIHNVDEESSSGITTVFSEIQITKIYIL